MNSGSDSAHFGEHLTVDGYGGNAQLLNDRAVLAACLEDLPELLGMTKLSPVATYEAPENNVKDPGGWSGFVVIAESHISVHTFPRRQFVSADVYTCRNGIDAGTVINYFKMAYALLDVETHLIKRGTRYPSVNIV